MRQLISGCFFLVGILFTSSIAVDLDYQGYEDIQYGRLFTISWRNASKSITIYLVGSEREGGRNIETIAFNLPADANGHDWVPDESLPEARYYIRLTDGVTNVERSPGFELKKPSQASPTIIPYIFLSRRSSSSSLSTGTIAGIAVGSALVFILLFVLLVFIYRTRKRAPSQEAASENADLESTQLKVEPEAGLEPVEPISPWRKSKFGQTPPGAVELDGTMVGFMAVGQEGPIEVDAGPAKPSFLEKYGRRESRMSIYEMG